MLHGIPYLFFVPLKTESPIKARVSYVLCQDLRLDHLNFHGRSKGSSSFFTTTFGMIQLFTIHTTYTYDTLKFFFVSMTQ